DITFPNGMRYFFKPTKRHIAIDKALDADYASTFKLLVKKKILHPRRFRANYRPKIHDQNPRMIDQFREDTHPGNDVPIDLGMTRLVDDAGVAVKEGFFEKPRTSVAIPDEFRASRQHQIYMRQAGRRAFLTDTVKEARQFMKKFPRQEALRQFVVEDINTSIGYPTSLDLWWNNSLRRLKGALGDRPAESAMRFLKDLEYTGGLGFNLTSPLKNITQLSNTAGEVGISWTALGVADLALDILLYPFRRIKAEVGRTNPQHPFS
ncbi:unnamed protein product, partial [marine sediment metagenome]